MMPIRMGTAAGMMRSAAVGDRSFGRCSWLDEGDRPVVANCLASGLDCRTQLWFGDAFSRGIAGRIVRRFSVRATGGVL